GPASSTLTGTVGTTGGVVGTTGGSGGGGPDAGGAAGAAGATGSAGAGSECDLSCDADQVCIAELDREACVKACIGNVTLTTQAELAALAAEQCEAIMGFLRIT